MAVSKRRSQIVEGKQTNAADTAVTKKPARSKVRALAPMRKAYECLTHKAIIGGKKINALGKLKERIISLSIEEANKLRERGIALRFPQKGEAQEE